MHGQIHNGFGSSNQDIAKPILKVIALQRYEQKQTWRFQQIKMIPKAMAQIKWMRCKRVKKLVGQLKAWEYLVIRPSLVAERTQREKW